jgi:hypothetical protein
VVVILAILSLCVHAMETARWVALASASLACALTAANLVQHAWHWWRPALQVHAVRILGMVPVYALASTLALFLPRSATLVFIMRDVYEAFVLFAFTSLLVAYLGGDAALVEVVRVRWEEEDARAADHLARTGLAWFSDDAAAAAALGAGSGLSADRLLLGAPKPQTGGPALPMRDRWERVLDATLGCGACRRRCGDHGAPQDTLRPTNGWRVWWASPEAHVATVRWAILQYALLMPVLGLVNTVLASLELARRGDFSAEGAFLWLTVVQTLSGIVSVLALLHLYWLVRRAMPAFSPGAKFACVKAIIFLSYVQLIALELTAFVGTVAGGCAVT